VHQLDLIRAAAEDVAAARMLLNERIGALNAIVATALDHDIPAAKVAEAAQVARLDEFEGLPLGANKLLVA
jgi:hypothetical protein